ncbi:MAG TPA: ferredoxin [Pseudonocardia sp.]
MKRVVVDSSLCQGHNRCVDIAKDLFDTDDEGYVRLIGGGVLTPEQVDRAELAEANCPERAISVAESEKNPGAGRTVPDHRFRAGS